MIKREELLALDYYKKAKFTGSYSGMRYRVESAGEKPDLKLKATVWPEPMSFDKTADDKKTSEEFEFSKDGLVKITDWLNDKYNEMDWSKL